jgi:NAD-dependent DNA ligase
MITTDEGKLLAAAFFEIGFGGYSTAQIISVLELADELYFNDEEPLMEDSEYDALSKYAKNTDPTNAYFLGIGSDVRGGKVTLPFQMGSLDQVYDGEIEAWVKKWSLESYSAVESDKLDGTSGLVVYDADGNFQIGYSRGNGTQGADISRHLSQMPSVPKKINHNGQPLAVRGENIISIRNFPIIKTLKTRNGTPYKNARNMVSGLMNASVNPVGVYQYVDFVVYEIVGSKLGKTAQLQLLEELGFNVVSYRRWKLDNINDGLLVAEVKNRKQYSAYELDGIVLEVDSAAKRAEMNPTSSTLNPAYAIKYKITDASNVVIATVVDVEINISKHGYLKPRVEISPVELVGVTVTWATGFNMKFICENKIGPGSKVKVTRSGDVVPFIMEVLHPSTVADYDEWFTEKTLQYGYTHWTETGVDLVLDDANSKEALYGQLVDFFDAIKAPHLGEGNLQKIFDMGFETPESVIMLTQEDLSSLLNSKVNAKKIFNGLREKLTNIPLYLLMGAHNAFGRGVGVRKMKALYDAFNGDMSLCESYSKILDVKGFEHKTATKVQTGYPQFLNFLREVQKVVVIAPYMPPASGNFSGKIVVFTGFRDANLQKLIEQAGGKIGSSISSKTSLVVTNNPDGASSKLDKARELNIPIVGISDIKEML